MKRRTFVTASGTALSAAAAGFLKPLRALASSSDQLWSDGSYADLYLSENFGPVMEEVTSLNWRCSGSIPAAAERTLSAQWTQSAGQRRFEPPSLVLRRRYGARCATRTRGAPTGIGIDGCAAQIW